MASRRNNINEATSHLAGIGGSHHAPRTHPKDGHNNARGKESSLGKLL
jgi:hypothetical protein